MAPRGVAGPSSWSWLAIVFAFREAQAWPLSSQYGELPSQSTASASLFAAVPPVMPSYSRSWPNWDPSAIYGDHMVPSPMSKRKAAGRVGGGRLHFATFATPGFEQAMADLCKEAEQSGLFAQTHCYKEVPADAMVGRWNAIRRKQNVKVEWLYQPAMVQYLLRNVIPPGDTLLFVEASVDISFNETKWSSLANLLSGGGQQGTSHILAFQRSDTPEFVNTKADVFREFGVWMDDVEVKSYQISASYFLMQNIRPVHLFLTNFGELLENQHLLSDASSHAPNHKDFGEHHHEASLWSMMVKANRPGSSCRPAHRIQGLHVRILPYSGCDDLRQVPAMPLQAHCLRHRKALKNRLES